MRKKEKKGKKTLLHFHLYPFLLYIMKLYLTSGKRILIELGSWIVR